MARHFHLINPNQTKKRKSTSRKRNSHSPRLPSLSAPPAVRESSFRARATTTKNGKEVILPLHPELARELAKHKASDASPMDRVFSGVLTKKVAPLKQDLKAAKVAYVDANGEEARLGIDPGL